MRRSAELSFELAREMRGTVKARREGNFGDAHRGFSHKRKGMGQAHVNLDMHRALVQRAREQAFQLAPRDVELFTELANGERVFYGGLHQLQRIQ